MLRLGNAKKQPMEIWGMHATNVAGGVLGLAGPGRWQQDAEREGGAGQKDTGDVSGGLQLWTHTDPFDAIHRHGLECQDQ